MPSRALQFWQGPAQIVLGEVAHAHRQVGGTGPGRRHLTQQINYAYVTLLVGQFQAFARSLHSEIAEALGAGVPDPKLRLVVEGRMTDGRALDRGNPSPSNLGGDFGRFGLEWWSEVNGHRAANAKRMRKLEGLVTWRNAIVHGRHRAQTPSGRPRTRPRRLSDLQSVAPRA